MSRKDIMPRHEEKNELAKFLEEHEGAIELIERMDCTEETTKLIADGIKSGLCEDDASKIIGVSPYATEKWKHRGKKEFERLVKDRNAVPDEYEKQFLNYYIEIERAMPLRKYYLVDRIRNAGRKTWQANAWLLERLHPDEFGKKTQVEVVDWRTKVIEGIRKGSISFVMLEREVGQSETERLFIRAGVGIPATVETREPSETSGDVINGEFTD